MDRLNCPDPFVCHRTVPTLKNMSKNQVAIDVFYCSLSQILNSKTGFFRREFSIDFISRTDWEGLVHQLGTPTSINEMLFESFNNVSYLMFNWVKILKKDIQYGYGFTDINPDWCLWDTCLDFVNIDYRKSVLKIVTEFKLSNLEKFLLFCTFCMKKEIATVPLDSVLNNLPAEITPNADPLVYYWICYRKGNLDRTVLLNAAQGIPVHCRSTPVLEYFWDQLNDDEKVTIMVVWIKSCRQDQPWRPRIKFLLQQNEFKWRNILQLFATLDFRKQLQVLDETFVDIVHWSLLVPGAYEWALWAWDQFKHKISVKQFTSLLSTILETAEGTDIQIKFVIKIWNSSNYDLRCQVAHKEAKDLVHSFYNGNWPGSREFFCLLFNLIATDSRDQVILECVEHMISEKKIRILHGFDVVLDMLPCSTNKGHSELKRKIAQSYITRHWCYHLLAEGNFDYVYRNLDWCFGQDIESSRVFIRQVLGQDGTPGLLRFCLKIKGNVITDKWNEMRNLIRVTFPSIKEQIAVERNILHSFAHYCRFNDNALFKKIGTIVRIIEATFDEVNLILIKESFITSFGESLRRREYWKNEVLRDEKFFVNFLEWGIGDYEKCGNRFKKIASQNLIFERIMWQVKETYKKYKYVQFSLLERLDAYLMWYLGTKEAVREYKLHRANEYSAKLKIFLWIEKRKDTQSLQILRSWLNQ